MTDMSGLISKGPGSAGAAGLLQGIAGRRKEDRESRADREKNALAAFISLTEEGWKPVDESRGASGGEVVHIEGFGSFVPPPVGGESQLDLAKIEWTKAKTFNELMQGDKASRWQPEVKTQVLRNEEGKLTLHERRDGEWVDTGKEAKPTGSETNLKKAINKDGKITWHRVDPTSGKLIDTGTLAPTTKPDKSVIRMLASFRLNSLEKQRRDLLNSLEKPKMFVNGWRASDEAKAGNKPNPMIQGYMDEIEKAQDEVEWIDSQINITMNMIQEEGKINNEQLPPWLNENIIKYYMGVTGLDRKKVIAMINKQAAAMFNSQERTPEGAPIMTLPVPRK
jgi:hypothetical protein